jgi:hypothetical protein
MQDKGDKQDGRYHKSGDNLRVVPALGVGRGERVGKEKNTRDT